MIESQSTTNSKEKYVRGEQFYRQSLHKLEAQQKGLASYSYGWTILQEEIELARLKWKQVSRRKDLVSMWEYQNRHKHRQKPAGEKPASV